MSDNDSKDPKITLDILPVGTPGTECPNLLTISTSEGQGLEWLINLLDTIIKKKGRSAEKAQYALSCLGRIVEHGNALHVKLDDIEEALVSSIKKSSVGGKTPPGAGN